MKTKIYALLNPEGKIRYIGKTVYPLSRRLGGHLCNARKNIVGHRCDWIRSLLKIGKLPTIQLIGEIDGDGSKEEIAWIKYFKDEGVDLVNDTIGGKSPMLGKVAWNKGKHCSEETKQKLRLANIGKELSPEHILKMSLALKGKPGYWLGKKFSKKTCHQISLSRMGHVVTEETRRKISAKNKGAIRTPETRRKISFSLTGRKQSSELIRKRTEGLRRVRDKLSIAQKLRWIKYPNGHK